MGCDIHLYIEYSDPNWRTPQRAKRSWNSFGKDIHATRHYDVFARLAGVRGNPDDCLVPPRGLPEDCSRDTFHDYWIMIVDEKDGFEFNQCLLAEAEEFVKSGKSRYYGNPPRLEGPWQLEYVSDPDWFSPSWLSCSEYAAAIAGFNDVLYNTILTVMKNLEQSGYETRVVFWFDQ